MTARRVAVLAFLVGANLFALYVAGFITTYHGTNAGIVFGTERHHIGYEVRGPEGPGLFTEGF